MDVLSIVKSLVSCFAYDFGSVMWAHRFTSLQDACALVDRRRLPYVLSTLVEVSAMVSLTLLHYCITDSDIVKWLCHVGVCPNVGVTYACFQGWRSGSRHPGRPTMRKGYVVLSDKRRGGGTDTLLGHGAYPAFLLRNVDSSKRYRHALRQWHRWHARSSRRLWIAQHCTAQGGQPQFNT
jgi:hypothetical protein